MSKGREGRAGFSGLPGPLVSKSECRLFSLLDNELINWPDAVLS